MITTIQWLAFGVIWFLIGYLCGRGVKSCVKWRGND